MADAKHTSGPWSFSPQKGKPGHCHMAQVWNSAGDALAQIEPTPDEAVATADARLIAAAPDLLEALKGIVADDDAGVSLNDQRARWSDRMSAAKAAILKATGA